MLLPLLLLKNQPIIPSEGKEGESRNMKTCLITGGAGFIGSHLAEELLRRGARITIVDDLSTGSLSNLNSIREDKRVSFHQGNVANLETMRPLIEQADEIYHLAAAVGVQLVFNKPTHTIQTNIRGAEVVLELAAHGMKKVFIASTSEVYGKGVRLPLAETDDLLLGPTTCPRWSYACSKAIDEFLALAYWKEQKLPVVIGRFFNTVGPRQTGRYGMVIPRFVEQAKRGEAITVYGSGGQSRCFAYVKDVARAVVELMQKPEAAGEVFNIGNDREITILELARKVIANTPSKSEIKFVEFEQANGPGFEDMERRVPDLGKLSRVLGWKPSVGIDEILTEVANA